MESDRKQPNFFGDAAQTLSSLAVVPKLDNDTPLATMTADLVSAALRLEHCDAQLQVQAGLAAPGKFTATEGLQSLVDGIRQLQQDHQRLNMAVAILKSLCSPPPISDWSPLRESVIVLEKTTEQLANNQTLVDAINDSLADFENDSQQWLQGEPACGTCGARLSAESIRFKMHKHGS